MLCCFNDQKVLKIAQNINNEQNHKVLLIVNDRANIKISILFIVQSHFDSRQILKCSIFRVIYQDIYLKAFIELVEAYIFIL